MLASSVGLLSAALPNCRSSFEASVKCDVCVLFDVHSPASQAHAPQLGACTLSPLKPHGL